MKRAYAILVPLMSSVAGLLFWLRGSHCGGLRFPWLVAVPGLVILGVGVVLDKKAQDHIKFRILIGVPEFEGATESILLNQGVYGRIRHPRYAAISLTVIGTALLTHYLVSYLIVGMTVLGLWVVAILEERELLDRFGDEYRSYTAVVPRLIPRMRSGSRKGGA